MAANPALQSQGLPMSLDEVEKLVRTLYDPGNAKKFAETEATLRVLQRSPQGWDVGDALLQNPDENVRFFGALTLTVKLNADSYVCSSSAAPPPSPHNLLLTFFVFLFRAGLTEEDGKQLLTKLIVGRLSCCVCIRTVS